MGAELERVGEFGVLDALADRAYWEYQYGDQELALRHCDEWLALADALGDEATARYLLFTRGRVLTELGHIEAAVATAEVLLARSAQDLYPYWQAKAIAVRALATRLVGGQNEVIDLLARTWVLVGRPDGRAYNQVSAAVVMANALRMVELYEQSDAQLFRLRWLVDPVTAPNVLVDSMRTLAEWGVRLLVVGYEREAGRMFAELASRGALLRRLVARSGRTEHLVFADAAEGLASVGLGDLEAGLAVLTRLETRGVLRRGRIEWLMATCAHGYALSGIGRYGEAEERLYALRDEARARNRDVWVTAADGALMLTALDRHGQHPAIPHATRMFRQVARQLWSERQQRFEAVRSRVLIHELQRESERATALSTLDALTGVGNRRALHQRMDGVSGRVAGLFVDLDDFKAVNDRYSHVTGDEVLVRVAQELRTCVLPGDLISRFGGDEFVILPAADRAVSPEEIQEMADRVVTAVRAVDWGQIAPGLEVTVSVGVAEVADVDDLLVALSTAVRAAKRSGRNRTMGPPV
ncbi:diguanylate cyclase domain-containing protein [Cellulomonas hominis]